MGHCYNLTIFWWCRSKGLVNKRPHERKPSSSRRTAATRARVDRGPPSGCQSYLLDHLEFPWRRIRETYRTTLEIISKVFRYMRETRGLRYCREVVPFRLSNNCAAYSVRSIDLLNNPGYNSDIQCKIEGKNVCVFYLIPWFSLFKKISHIFACTIP